MTFQELLSRPLIYLDGGTGTMLQARGLRPDERTESWTIERPEDLIQIHQSYIAAGADIVNANTFGVNKFRYGDGSAYSLSRLVETAIANAKQAVRQAGKETETLVSLDLGPSGDFMEPFGDLTYEEAFDNFRQLVIAGEKAGADCISIETMFSCQEAQAALEACGTYCKLPVLVSFSFQENGRLLTGETVADVAKTADSFGAAAVGFNCGFGPVQMKPLVKELLNSTALPVIAKPNAGLPKTVDGKTCYTMEPAEFAAVMSEIADMGARLIGGCCGTTPAFIRCLRSLSAASRQIN